MHTLPPKSTLVYFLSKGIPTVPLNQSTMLCSDRYTLSCFKNIRKNVKKRESSEVNSPYHFPFFYHLSYIGSHGAWNLFQGTRETKQGTPWLGCQPIMVHSHEYTHTLWSMWTEMPFSLKCMFLDWEGPGENP